MFAQINLSTQSRYRIAIMMKMNLNSKNSFPPTYFVIWLIWISLVTTKAMVFLKVKSCDCLFSITVQSAEDKANPQNLKLDYTVNESSSANASTSTKECSSEKTLLVRNRGSKWKRNVNELTDLIVALSRDKHSLRQPCSSTCRLQCSATINVEGCRVLWSKFWILSYSERRNYLFQSIEKQTPQKRVLNSTKNQKVSIAYHLKDEFGSFSIVCKTFFDFMEF